MPAIQPKCRSCFSGEVLPCLLQHAAEAVSSALFSGESSEAYVYSYKVKTSCNDGASTDGGLKVKITDSK